MSSKEQRFQQLFNDYHRQVYAYCRRRIDEGSAQDCASETFLVAWRRIDSVPSGDRALRWLYAVARRVLANKFRSRRRSRDLITRLGGLAANRPPTPDTEAVRSDENREVLEALARLRPKDQELLRLAVWEELPHGQVGEVLGCSAHAAGQRIRRAEDRLVSELRRTGHRHQWNATPDPLRGEKWT